MRSAYFFVAFAFAFGAAFALTLAFGLVFVPIAFAVLGGFFAVAIRPRSVPDTLDDPNVVVRQGALEDHEILPHVALARGAGQRDHAYLDREPKHDLLSR
jgi:hypothetical protein